MEEFCKVEGCFEPRLPTRRLCKLHYRAQQVEYNRKAQQTEKSKDDEIMEQFEGAVNIGKSVWANEQTVRLQEEELGRVGYKKQRKRTVS